MGSNWAFDTELGEVPQENEEQLAQQIADYIAAKIRRDFDAKRIRQGSIPPLPVAVRDAHPKAHGCVQALFQVEKHLEPDLAQGVFVPGASYKAWIRFSNGNEDDSIHDAEGDGRGMAIKLLDVPGDKILPEERDAQTQDFIMINYPVFFIDDAARYLALKRAKDLSHEDWESFHDLFHGKEVGSVEQMLEKNVSDLGTILKGFTGLSPRGALNFWQMTHGPTSKISSPLETVYWSMVPYRLGDSPNKRKIKFRAKPHMLKEPAIKPVNPSKDFLREAMIKQLSFGAGSRQFDFEVQRGAPDMSVENSIIEWKEEEEKGTHFKKVATITIPEQEFAKAERNEFGEMLSFTPWHALPQHRPLGAVNRIRRVVYQTTSKLRHELNNSKPREPTARDPVAGVSVWPEITSAER
jgi:hypothetical protein